MNYVALTLGLIALSTILGVLFGLSPLWSNSSYILVISRISLDRTIPSNRKNGGFSVGSTWLPVPKEHLPLAISEGEERLQFGAKSHP
jgi:hypothetical protein